MSEITMTYRLAMAAGRDAANRQMRKADRKKWNEEDAALATETFQHLFFSDPAAVADHFDLSIAAAEEVIELESAQ